MSKAKKKKKSGGQISMNFYKDERWPKMIGLFLIFISLYLLIAFTSYLFTWKQDWDKAYWAILLRPQEMSNWLGRLGAVLSHSFFYWGFGISSYVFVGLFYKTGYNLVMGEGIRSMLKIYRRGLVSMVWTSCLLQFIFQSASSQFPWGGSFGALIIGSLSSFVGTAGIVGMLIFIALIILVWLRNPNFQEWTPQFFMSSLAPKTVLRSLSRVFNNFLKGESPFQAEQLPKNQPKPKDVKAAGDKNESLKEKEEPKTLRPRTQEEREAELPKHTEDQRLRAEGLVVEEAQPEKKSKSKELEERVKGLTENQLELNLEAKKKEQAESDGELDVELLSDQDKLAQDVAIAEENSDHIEPYDPTLELPRYESPVLDLLESYEDQKPVIDRAELEANKDQIIETLLNYKIEIVKIKATIGPTVTLYEIVPAPGVRISKIKNLEDDIALSLAALGIRIIAPIPGRGTIGIEVPNRNKQIVSLKEVLASPKFKNAKMDLPIALGKSISNEVFVADLAKMPHLLIAGATGQGKSVGINTIIASLLYKKHPSQLKLILIDPKKVELSPYNAIAAHFLGYLPGEEEAIVTETAQVIQTLYSLTVEMDERYNLLKKARVRNLNEYNAKFVARRLNPEKGHRFLPFIVLVIDEFADLIMTAGKEVELPIGRLAQLARAVGIHLIIATQRPSVNIITGVIKANFPARLAFKVASKIDSRTILDAGGAEQLIGRGDMLLSSGSTLLRLQCAFVDTPEVERIIDHIAEQPGYPEPYYLPTYGEEGGSGGDQLSQVLHDLDEYFEDAARLVVINQSGSTSMIQRRLKLGYNRAGRIMDQLEHTGIVGPNQGSKARDVLFMDEIELEEYLKHLRDQKNKLSFK
ncbi:FtsK/SpoIIIE family DNA translocase [Saprospira grandis]|uniref:FtsK/SpoIIIE family DNA translocase n=1 Tax=Saprospira grandis TaxID=1008 RepID=UPI0022DDA6CE|nr:DNA translocase FtsK [Saprospira grandis]WBM73699.1 DNA translocase FtsK [Saprospira grandis]